MTQFVFYIFWILTAISAIVVIVHPNPVYGAFSLVFCSFFIGGIYAMLGAHFIATIQVLVYTGGIMVLFIFVIMLLNLKKEDLRIRMISTGKMIAVLLSAFFLFMIGKIFYITNIKRGDGLNLGSIESVGSALFTIYLVPFEVISVLLLVAIIGAAYLSRRREIR